MRDERGIAMVEFALIVPVLLLIVAGMLGFGRVLFYWIDANHLANETTRWAAVDRNPYGTSLQQYIADSGTAEFKNGLRVCLDFPDGGSPQIGQRVRMRVEKPFTFVPIVGLSLTVKASSTQRIERFANGTGPTSYAAGNFGAACT
jgi:Flp pilus assembly pilin Flp